MAALSEGTLAALLRNAGFPEDKVPLMVNIAKRESGLRPGAHNPNAATGDNSYGLFQINMIGDLGPARLKEFADIGVQSYEDLKDPWKNVLAAKKVLDSQGLGAWTTYQDALRDPTPAVSGGSLDELAAFSSIPAVGRTLAVSRPGDPLVATAEAMVNQGLSSAPERTRMAMGLEAQRAAIEALTGTGALASSGDKPVQLGIAPGSGLGSNVAYIQGGIGPSGASHYGPHFDIKGINGEYFDRAALDPYVKVNGQALSSGLTVPGGEFGASRDGGARKHTGWDYAFGDNAALKLTGGAQWLGSQSTDYGDAAQFRLPDGRTFKILHGKLNRA
jgi:hypothetical protein